MPKRITNFSSTKIMRLGWIEFFPDSFTCAKRIENKRIVHFHLDGRCLSYRHIQANPIQLNFNRSKIWFYLQRISEVYLQKIKVRKIDLFLWHHMDEK